MPFLCGLQSAHLLQAGAQASNWIDGQAVVSPWALSQGPGRCQGFAPRCRPRASQRSQEPLPSLRCPSGCQAQLMKSDRDGFSQTEIPKGDRCLLDGGQRRSINVTGFLHCCPQLSALLSSPRGRRHAFPYLFCGHLAFLYEGIWC